MGLAISRDASDASDPVVEPVKCSLAAACLGRVAAPRRRACLGCVGEAPPRPGGPATPLPLTAAERLRREIVAWRHVDELCRAATPRAVPKLHDAFKICSVEQACS